MLGKKRSRYSHSEKLFTAASRILPGGVDSPVRAFKSVGATPLFIVRGRGAQIEDADGHKYIDYVMSWGPLIHGHAPKGLLKALADAASRGTSFGAPTELETRLARRVAMLMPSMERVRFVSSGTEAAMSAARVARAATRRDRIVKFEGCYHGHADSFLVQAGSGATTLGVPTSPGVPAAVVRRHAAGAVQRSRLGARASSIATAGRSPRSSSSRLPATWGWSRRGEGFLPGLREICDREGILLVFDEVISGFRAATGGAQQIFGIRPDLTCLGKIIGGGLPVGAYGGRADIMALVAPAGPVYQAGTLSGNPLAMTAGIWALEELSAQLYKHLAKLGAQLAAGLADAARGAGVALQVNAFGSLLTPFFTSQPVRDYQSALSVGHRGLRPFLPGDAGARHLSAAVAVRGLVPVGSAHVARCGENGEGREGRVQAEIRRVGDQEERRRLLISRPPDS